jgi:hypothetical protein
MNVALLSSRGVFERAMAGISNFNGENDEPFSLEITNGNSTSQNFYLSQGLLYQRGNESDGQLKTGSFKSISGAALTASTSNSISIEQFIAYMQANPTKIWRMEATTTNPTGQLSGTMQSYRQGAIKDEVPTLEPLRKYANGNQYNLQFQNFTKPRYISGQDIVTMPIAANSTLTLNIYPEASKNERVSLQNDVRRESNPDAASFSSVLPNSGEVKSEMQKAKSGIKKLSTANKILLAAAIVLVAWWILKK